jgi:hypothetical protein
LRLLVITAALSEADGEKKGTTIKCTGASL